MDNKDCFATLHYKGFNINTCYNRNKHIEEVTVMFSTPGGYSILNFKSTLAAKQAITKHINKGN